MDIEIIERKENPLLDREEIKFEVTYDQATPSREVIKKKLAAMLNVDAEITILREIKGHFGKTVSSGFATVYPSYEIAQKVETKPILKRNTFGGDSDE